MKLVLVLGCFSFALAEPEAWQTGLPLVYTHPQVQTIYQYPGYPSYPSYPNYPSNTNIPSYPTPNPPAQNTIPYGCTVDCQYRNEIEKVEYVEEKCETKYK